METSDASEDKEIEDIKKDEKVQRALSETSIVEEKVSAGIIKKEAPFLGMTVIIFLSCGALYFLLGQKILPIAGSYIPLLQRIVLAVMLISLVLIANRLLKKLVNRKIKDKTKEFNFNRIADFFAALLILAIILSLLFANWYAAAVSFGIISLTLGFALQNPITSFFAWLYILIRKPYEVGERIKIGNVFGDVINVSYLDTTLWEFNGDYLSADHPSGRIIRFANSKVFSEYVYNYSWPLFPFIWNEFSFFISYDSDFDFTAATTKQIVEVKIGESMVRRVRRFKKILADTPVDEFDVNEYPSVILKAHVNTWIEVTVRYLVEPKSSGRVRKELFEIVMEELKKHPEKVIFPNSTKQKDQ
ncbi:mechanosensitive ion channel family protein [Aquiflexum sp. TKW24L]|uniref:mechanosensitive ion channel family protein n=1 Tax=Aquiflexum sp. TKW24L TaxID=2942212 RepID=UPI0020BDEB5D|nr:mechanosensitive ion channel domain-containing protein [Aquiflexum sp. TKW24L]MCL6260920.1 mechanosensitive ion channel family protein [Aquiflexum sp. TKW24L]